MTLVLDAGALVAADRNDRDLAALVKRELRAGRPPVTHGGVIGQVWRDDRGRQSNLARFVGRIDVRALDDKAGRRAGVLLGRARLCDVIDAAVVLLANDGDEILTSDAEDLRQLADHANVRVDIVPI